MSEDKSSPKKAKKWYQQQFKKEWLNEPSFRIWLRQDNDSKYSAVCVICDCKMKNPNKSALLAHQKTAKHLRLFKKNGENWADSDQEINKDETLEAHQNTGRQLRLLNKKNKYTEGDKIYEDGRQTKVDEHCKKLSDPDLCKKIATAELLLSAFVAEHSLPISQLERLFEVLKKMCPDSAIAQSLTTNEVRAAGIGEDNFSRNKSSNINGVCEETSFAVSCGDPTRMMVHGVDMTEEVTEAVTSLKSKLRLLSEHLNCVDDPAAVIECLKAMSSVGIVIERYKKLW